MIAYQCDNDLLYDDDDAPDTDAVSTDMCLSGLGTSFLYKKCSEVLFTWGPGSKGERLPGNMGLEAKPVNSN